MIEKLKICVTNLLFEVVFFILITSRWAHPRNALDERQKKVTTVLRRRRLLHRRVVARLPRAAILL